MRVAFALRNDRNSIEMIAQKLLVCSLTPRLYNIISKILSLDILFDRAKQTNSIDWLIEYLTDEWGLTAYAVMSSVATDFQYRILKDRPASPCRSWIER